MRAARSHICPRSCSARSARPIANSPGLGSTRANLRCVTKDGNKQQMALAWPCLGQQYSSHAVLHASKHAVCVGRQHRWASGMQRCNALIDLSVQFGQQALSTNSTAHGTPLGTQKRFRSTARHAENPTGPGQYPVLRVKLSALSTRGPEPPSIAFGTGSRDSSLYMPVCLQLSCSWRSRCSQAVPCNGKPR